MLKPFNLKTPYVFLAFLLLIYVAIYPSSASCTEKQKAHEFASLQLKQKDVFYSLTNLNHASGFFSAPLNTPLKDFEENQLPSNIPTTLRPRFKDNHRQWLYAKVKNETSQSKWVMHVSHFFIKKIQVLVRDSNGLSEIAQFSDESTDQVYVNAIGRGIEIHLEPNKNYLLAIEIGSDINVMAPYIALATYDKYLLWASQLDLVFTTAIGFIVAFVILALLTFVLLRDATFFWFSLCSLLLLGFYLRRTGLPSEFIAKPYDAFGKVIWPQVSLLCFSLTMFCSRFLQIDKGRDSDRESGRLYQMSVATLGLTLAVFAIGFWVPRDGNIYFYGVNAAVLVAFIAYSGVLKMRSSGAFYVIYLVGWLPVCISIVEFLVFIFVGEFQVSKNDVSYKPVRDLYFQIAHILIITAAMILRNLAIREKKIQAEFLSEAKSRFIVSSQKNMQVPLNYLQTGLNSLSRYVTSPISHQLIASLQRLANEVSDNFGTMSQFNKLEEGVNQIKIQPVSLSKLFNKLQKEYDVQATSNFTRLRIRPTDMQVLSDPALLERMLRNLISNAIKFSQGGRVLVGCRYRRDGVVIQVLDNGCGIAEADKAKIFKEYRRVADKKMAVEGSGIGLSIVKYLSDLLSHPVTLYSTPGQGSIFSIKLQRVISRQESNSVVSASATKPQIVLCISDSALSEYVKKLLSDWRYPVKNFSGIHEIDTNLWSSLDAGGVIISDLNSLVAYTVQTESRQKFKKFSTRFTAAAFLCDTSVTVPAIIHSAGWLPLPLPLHSTQLVAFLNYACQRNRT